MRISDSSPTVRGRWRVLTAGAAAAVAARRACGLRRWFGRRRQLERRWLERRGRALLDPDDAAELQPGIARPRHLLRQRRPLDHDVLLRRPAQVQEQHDGDRAGARGELRGVRGRQDVDVQAAPRRQVRRRHAVRRRGGAVLDRAPARGRRRARLHGRADRQDERSGSIDPGARAEDADQPVRALAGVPVRPQDGQPEGRQGRTRTATRRPRSSWPTTARAPARTTSSTAEPGQRYRARGQRELLGRGARLHGGRPAGDPELLDPGAAAARRRARHDDPRA